MEITDACGFPEGLWSRVGISSASPADHDANDGDANNPFNFITRSWRSLAG